MTRKIDEQIEALASALPAPDYEQIRLKMQRTLRQRIGRGIVTNVLHYVRKHADELGWTVPHAKRGIPRDGEGDRFFVALKTGGARLTEDELGHLRNGAHGTVGTAASQMRNLETMLAMCAQHAPRVEREWIDDLRENVAFVARRAARTLVEMDRRNGTEG